MVSDIEVEKDEDKHVENPDSDVVEMENEKLLKLERSGVEEKSGNLKEVVEKSELPLSNRVSPDAKDLEVGTKDCLVKDGCADVAAVAGIIVPPVDSNVEDNSNDIQNVSSQAGEDNKKSTDVRNQIESVTPSDSFSEVKRKDEKDEELTVGEIGMDMSNGASAVQSTVGNGTKEIELKNEEVRNDDTLHDGVKMDTSTDTVSGLDMLPESEMKKEELTDRGTGMNLLVNNELKGEVTLKNSFLEPDAAFGEETVTVEEQAEFMKELETFHKERCLEFKPPRFYGEPLNCLKLWRAVVKLGGYEQVTSCKLWRQVGESFKPPKTCTTVSWTFRVFYEKALLEYEKHKMRCGELPYTDASFLESTGAGNQASLNQAVGSGRARRDAAARAMQGWHSRLLGNGEVGDPIVKDKNSSSVPKREKQLKSIGLLKRKAPSPPDHAVKVARVITSKPQLDTMVVDIGSPADWVKINVQKTKDCYEIYALVPGLLREEVRVQTDPAGRLVISGEPEQLDNPWGVSPFKKIVSLPTRIDPQQTSALVTLHGQLFVRVPFEQSEM